MSKRTVINPKDAARTQVVLGTPIFSNDPNSIFQMPLGQKDLAEPMRLQTRDPQELYRLLALEYVAIMTGLVRMRIGFQVALSHRHLIIRGLLENITTSRVPTVDFPEDDLQASAYPRDFVTWIPGRLLLVPPYLKPQVKGVSVVKSPYAVGGRILQRQDVALVSEQFDPLEDIHEDDHMGFSLACQQVRTSGVYPFTAAPIQPLKQAGLRVGLLPNAIVCGQLPDGSTVYAPDDHPDRVCGLLEDRRGKLHLIVDPLVHSGFDDVYAPPRFLPQETLRRYQEVCEGLGITLHVPVRLTIPASICFWQAPGSLKVLVTGGEIEVAGLVASIVGDENAFTTETPIAHLPAWCKAGIRCMIGEIPTWLL